MGNAPKITRRDFFLGKCHRVAMVACLNNVKLSGVLTRQEAALGQRVVNILTIGQRDARSRFSADRPSRRTTWSHFDPKGVK
jgi:hypothetical protein